MKVLVVFNQIPEHINFIVLNNVSMDTLDKVRKFHNNFVNAGNNEPVEQEINDFFYDSEGKLRYDLVSYPQVGTFDLIVITGFIL